MLPPSFVNQRVLISLSVAATLLVGAAARASANPPSPPALVDVLGAAVALPAPSREPTVLIFMSRAAKDASSAFARSIDEKLLDRPIESIGIVDVRKYGGILKRMATSYLKRSAEEAKVRRKERRVAAGVDASPAAVDRWHLIGDFDGSLFTRFGVGTEPAQPLAFVLDGAGAVHGPYQDVGAVVAAVSAATAHPAR